MTTDINGVDVSMFRDTGAWGRTFAPPPGTAAVGPGAGSPIGITLRFVTPASLKAWMRSFTHPSSPQRLVRSSNS